jgi:uncharacterized protein (DUF1330 family)
VVSFFIAQIDVHDQAGYDRYLSGTDALLERHAGRVLSVDTEPMVLEGEWPYRRTVLIEFPTRQDLDAWYRSAEYQQLAAHRWKASRANIVVIEGRK